MEFVPIFDCDRLAPMQLTLATVFVNKLYKQNQVLQISLFVWRSKYSQLNIYLIATSNIKDEYLIAIRSAHNSQISGSYHSYFSTPAFILLMSNIVISLVLYFYRKRIFR